MATRETVTEVSVVEGLQASRKYGALCEETLFRAAAWAVARHSTRKEVEKAARRKLHQVSSAYAPGGSPEQAVGLVREWGGGDERDLCLKVMGLHASTAERLPILHRVYEDLFALTGPPGRVVDLACGLHPFALPWMEAAAGAPIEYAGVECDSALVGAAEQFLHRSGRAGRVVCGDVLAGHPAPEGDLVLLLKALPCFDQQEKGSSERLLQALAGRTVVVSFPVRSLGGRAKGMSVHYEQELGRMLSFTAFCAEPVRTSDELFYVLR